MIKIFAHGNIGADATLFTFENGNSVTSFNLASNIGGYTTASGVEVPEKTEWINVKVFNRPNLTPHLTKGKTVSVSGDFQTQEKDGVKYVSLICDELNF